MMKSLGIKESECPVKEANKKMIHYPSFDITSKAIPEVADYKIKDKIKMEVELEVTNTRVDYEDKNEIVVGFKMLKGNIMNLKEDRKKAMEKGLEYEDYKEIMKKRNKES